MKATHEDIAEAVAILIEAGIAFEDESESRRGVHLCSEESSPEDESSFEDTPLYWRLSCEDVRGTYVGSIFWPGQLHTVGTSRSLVEATRWLVTMLGRFGIPRSRFADKEIHERLESAAVALRSAGFLAETVVRGGFNQVTFLSVRVLDEDRDCNFGVFSEPSGGYYVADPWPPAIGRECLCERPEDVVSWIAYSAGRPIEKSLPPRLSGLFPPEPDVPGLSGRRRHSSRRRSRRRE